MSTENLNIVICGHVDHGKSTLLGKLVVELGQVERAALARAEAFIRDFGAKTTANVYSALIARQTTEREQGRTFVPSHVRVRFGERELTIVDTPGSIEYKRGRVYGTFMADVGVLVVAANRGPEAQTREALLLLQGLGVPLAGVVVTKVDLGAPADGWEGLRVRIMDVIRETSVQLPVSGLRWAEVSALKGSVQPMVELLETLSVDRRAASGPLRFCVQGRQELFNVKGVGAVALGVVESGRLAVGDELAIEPVSSDAGRLVTVKVRSLQLARGRNELHGDEIPEARPRDIVSVGLARPWEELVGELSGGAVLSHVDSRPAVVSRVEAEITVLKKTTGAHIGWAPYLLAHVMGASCELVDIRAVRQVYKDTWTGEWSRNQSLVREFEEARVLLRLDRPLPLELRDGVSRMGRFSLREHHNVSALGVCTGFPKEQELSGEPSETQLA